MAMNRTNNVANVAVSAKEAAMKLVDKYGWLKAAVIFANQENQPALAVLLAGLDKGFEDLCSGWIWMCPSTEETISYMELDIEDIVEEIGSYIIMTN